jgi:drug/metabolite transporter (DMT)-like permease
MRPVVLLAFASILWGLTWWPLKGLHARGVDGIPLIFVAYGAVAALGVPLLVRSWRSWREQKGMMGLIALLGGLANLSFNSALVYGDVVRVMVLFYLLPFWGVLGGRIFLGEKLNALRGLSMFLALSGAFLVLGGPRIFSTPFAFVDVVAVVSGFTFAMNNICFRASQKLPLVSKVVAVFVGCAVGAGALLALGVQTLPSGVAPLTWLLVVGFGFYLLLASAGTQWGVIHLEAGRSSIIMILELLSAVLSSTLILHSSLSPLEILGGVLIIGASLLEARAAPAEPAPVSP